MHPEKSENLCVFSFVGRQPIVFHVDLCTIAPFLWNEMNKFTVSGGRQPDDNYVAAYSAGYLLLSDSARITGWWLDAVCGPADT